MNLSRGIWLSISPQAFTAQMNRATAETAQEAALAEGLAPIQNWVKRLVDDVIAGGFKDHPNDFQVFPAVLDQTAWQEGFISVAEAMRPKE